MVPKRENRFKYPYSTLADGSGNYVKVKFKDGNYCVNCMYAVGFFAT